MKGTSAPFVLQSEAAVSTSNLPHPLNYSFSQAEIDRLVAYAEAYSKGKFPDAKFSDVLTDEAKAARADAHEDLRSLNFLIEPQGMQEFLRDDEAYITARALATNRTPSSIRIDENLCIHLYTRILSLFKYNNPDKFTALRAAVEVGSKNKPDEKSTRVDKNNVRVLWGQLTQSNLLTLSDEAIKLADIVPSAQIAGKTVDLPTHLTADYDTSRKVIVYPEIDGRPGGPEGDPRQINPHVGYFLESYLKDMPVDTFYLFGLGLGNGYHSIMIAAKREAKNKNQYIIIDDHMMDDFRIATRNNGQSLTHERKISDKKIVDYFIQAYTGGAWGSYTASSNKQHLPPDAKGWPLVTSIFLLRPKQTPSSSKK